MPIQYTQNIKRGGLNTVAIIPARGGSKGLTCKNIRPLLGKPLLAWTIQQALACQSISEVIVSTDSEDIAAIAKDYGARVPFIRPKALSSDISLVGDVIMHTKNHLIQVENIRVDVVLTLLPSHPYRPPGMLDTAVEVLSQEAYAHFKTAVKVNVPPGSIVSMDNGYLVPTHTSNRGLPETFHKPIGLVWGQKLDCAYGMDYVYIVDDPCATIDIDSEADFHRAEQILEQVAHG